MGSLCKPSNANIWAKPGGCPGHGAMCAKFPKPFRQHPRALEGLASHELAALLINSSAKGTLGGAPTRAIIGTVWGKDKQIMTNEMYASAEIYASQVALKMIELNCFNPKIEYKVPVIGGGNGYIDCSLSNDLEKGLHIFDYKFGNGSVEVEENYQLLDYAISEATVGKIYKEVVLHISQPPVNGSDLLTWSVQLPQLLKYKEQMELAAADAMSNNPTTRVGTQCKYCDARWACVTFKHSAEWASEFAGSSIIEDATTEQLIDYYEQLTIAKRQAEYGLNAMREQLIQRLRRGENIPGYGYVHGKGKLQWIDEDGAMIESIMSGMDITTPVTLLTPTQAQAAGFDVSKYAVRSDGPMSLNKINSKEMFKNVKIN